MRNIDIVYRSKEMMGRYKSILMPVFLFICLVGFIPSLISNSLLTLIIAVVVLPVSQGLITSSLKAYRDSGEKIETYEDGLFGLKNYSRLFGTYFTYNFIKVAIFFIEVIVVTMLMFTIFGDQLYSATEQLSQSSLYAMTYFSYAYETVMEALALVFLFIFLPNLLVLLLTNTMYDLFFFPTYYLLEEDKRGFEAMGIAKRLMKGNKKQLFFLKLSFIGWIFLSVVVGGIIGVFYRVFSI